MINVKDLAPDFSAKDNLGEHLSIASLLAHGHKVILYFYPKDNTSGCTAEACSLRDGYEELLKMGFVVVGVSGDSESSHQKFIAKNELPFRLIVDTDHQIADMYGVWALKKFMGREYMGILRTTFIIDNSGVVEKIFTKVDTKDHFNQIVNSYK
ncbi:MAG: thioredoxin-dependent thiol peroxidase [Mucinivorans sp.]